MTAESRTGRPRASSRETLAEAACELFLEQGYEATSIADIAQRAGVSRSSFFNYFASKGDILWSGLDERIAAFERAPVRGRDGGCRSRRPRRDGGRSPHDFAPDSLALALVNAAAMGLVDELEREASLRRSRIARAVAERLRRGGSAIGCTPRSPAPRMAGRCSPPWTPGLTTAPAAATWTGSCASRSPRPPSRSAPSSAVRQLRVVVHATDFDEALRFYRDELGLPQQEAYEAEGDARVVILRAGRRRWSWPTPSRSP